MSSEPFQLNHSNVKEANMGDLEALQTLDGECFDGGMPSYADALKSRGATVILKVEHGNKIIAAACYIYVPKRKAAIVLRIMVDAPFRRRKIGSQLLALIRRELDKTTSLQICVQETDLISQIFLRSNNFTYVNKLEDHYTMPDGTHANAFEFIHGAPKPQHQVPKLKSNNGPLVVDLKNRFGRRGRKAVDEDDCV